MKFSGTTFSRTIEPDRVASAAPCAVEISHRYLDDSIRINDIWINNNKSKTVV